MCQVWLIREQFCVKRWSKDHHGSLIIWRGSRITCKVLLCIFIQSPIAPSRPSLPHTAPQLPLGPTSAGRSSLSLANYLCERFQLVSIHSTGAPAIRNVRLTGRHAVTQVIVARRSEDTPVPTTPLHTTKTMRSVANHLVSLATKPGVRLTNACRCMDMSAQKDV